MEQISTKTISILYIPHPLALIILETTKKLSDNEDTFAITTNEKNTTKFRYIKFQLLLAVRPTFELLEKKINAWFLCEKGDSIAIVIKG